MRTAAFSSALRSRTSFSAELSLSVSSISLNCLHSSRQPRSETTRPPQWSSASSDGAAPTRGAPVAEKREAAKLIMEGFMQAYDDKAAKFAPQGYNHRAQQSGARLK